MESHNDHEPAETPSASQANFVAHEPKSSKAYQPPRKITTDHDKQSEAACDEDAVHWLAKNRGPPESQGIGSG